MATPWIPAFEIALRRIRAWRVPPNWSVSDWFAEIRAHASAAACEAARDYDLSRGIPFSAFLYHRVVARSLTRYRQEWVYALRCVRERHQAIPDSPAEESTAPARRDLLLDVLASLPRGDRWLTEQLFWKGRTEADIAHELGISQPAVSKRKHQVLHHLQLKMSPSAETKFR